MLEKDRVVEAATSLRAGLGPDAFADVRLGLVLGSGLENFAATLQDPVTIRFADVPNWPVPRVEGHHGRLVLGRTGDVRIACLSGRVHLYEGWSPREVVRAVRTLHSLGVPQFLLTNAAGGIADGLRAGDLLVIRDHLNLTGCSPLQGAHERLFGPRFPDQTTAWDPELRERLAELGGGLRQGVYAGLLGPSYETPAEVRMLKTLGADVVGMSTVHEAIALNAMGAKVAGVSLVTNLAAGIAPAPLRHDEVVAAGRAAASTLSALVTRFCESLR